LYFLNVSKYKFRNGPTAMDINTTNAACGANNGRINITDVTGGAAPYTLSVDNGTFQWNHQLYSNMPAGNHVC
jgi:hypothetical protein